MDVRASELFFRDVLTQASHDRRSGYENLRCLAHHQRVVTCGHPCRSQSGHRTQRECDDGDLAQIVDDVVPSGVCGHVGAAVLVEALYAAAPARTVDETDDGDPQLVGHLLGVHLLLPDRRVGGAAPHREVVASHHDRPAIDAAAPEHEVGRGEVGEASVVVVGRSSGDRADLVERSRVEELFDPFAHGELAAVVLTLNLLRPTHAAGQFLTAPKFGDLGLPGIPHATDRTGPSRGRPTSSRFLDDRQTSR